jgi:hypothetical protein
MNKWIVALTVMLPTLIEIIGHVRKVSLILTPVWINLTRAIYVCTA